MPSAEHTQRRARPTRRPELDDRRGALSKLSNSRIWKRLEPALRFHCSYAAVPGAMPESDCWHWIGVTSDEGYGRFKAGDWKGQGHRLALERVAGVGSLGRRRVYRRCGDTACVNPDHLTVSRALEAWPEGVAAPRINGYGLTPGDLERFRRKVGDDPMITCQLWQGATNKSTGYGVFTVAGKPEPAHRIAYAIAHGSIPEGLSVCHGPACEALRDGQRDGRLCVNPAHLIADTPAANAADRNGGHFRRALLQIPMTPSEREATMAFPSIAVAVAKEQGDLDEGASVEELVAMDVASESAIIEAYPPAHPLIAT